jgi:MoxR-like ATPase
MTQDSILREPCEVQYQLQLDALAQHDKDDAPFSWKLSPRAVLTYILGGQELTIGKGKNKKTVPITQKYFGDRRLVERAIITLASDRALLLLGDPGTGKSWLSENLAAAICGDSTLTIQGTAGTTEEHIKYTWNIARVIAEGYTTDNIVPSPSMVAMQQGKLLRFEEITRCVSDVQDSLVSLLSEKNIAIPELPDTRLQHATPGFNVIATANSRDRGVNELSAALKRRFNYLHIPTVSDKKTELAIVEQRLAEQLQQYQLDVSVDDDTLDLLVTVFRELRNGSREGRDESSSKGGVTRSANTLSTAEVISVMLDASLHAHYYGEKTVQIESVCANIQGVMVKEDASEAETLKSYNEQVAKPRAKDSPLWDTFYQCIKTLE